MITFGVALDTAPSAYPLRETLANHAALLQVAEGYGFSSVWAGESYPSDEDDPRDFHASSAFLVLAALAPQTAMGIGSGVTLLPAWNPLKLAYDSVVLDHLTQGRFTLGIGLGGKDLWSRFGWAETRRGALADDVISMLQALWEGTRGFSGPQITVEGGIHPPPLSRGGPRLLIGGGVQRSAERAARADGYYASSTYSAARIEQMANWYADCRARAGLDEQGAVAANRITVIAKGDAEAEELARTYVRPLLDRYARIGSYGSMPAPLDEPAYERLTQETCLVGSVDRVRSQVEDYARRGVTEIQFRVAPIGTPVSVARSALALLGEGVVEPLPTLAPGRE